MPNFYPGQNDYIDKLNELALSNELANIQTVSKQYLGSKVANPTVDNEGGVLLVGATYWNTVTPEMRVWDGTAWVAVQTTSAATAAAGSATAAAGSATAAAGSASTASTQATNAAGSATAAATSATNSANSATTASTQASNAAGSATAASGSASTASTQATNAAGSATAAATSATDSANSATASSTSATNSANSATAAAGSATSAASSLSSVNLIFDTFDDRFLGSKTSAPTLDNDGNALVAGTVYYNSVTNAVNFYNGATWEAPAASATASATAAASSATAAAGSATAAAGSASTASTQATNAAGSASTASTQATNSANSATASATSATNAAASYDSFDDRYLGAKASEPTLDNDGAALITGALYFNSTTATMRVWGGTAWKDASGGSAITTTLFSGTGAQVAFVLASAPLSKSNTQVYINGVYQNKDTYSLAAATLTFTEAPLLGTNNIEVVQFSSVEIANAPASYIEYTPTGGIAATDVQAAITELDSEKQAVSSKDATGGYAGLTLFKLNLKNAANTFTNFLTNATTAARTWTLPDKDGTIAMTSDFAAPGAIGSTTPSTGAFTTLSANGGINSSNVSNWSMAASAGTRSINIATNSADANYFMGAGATSYYGTTTNHAVVTLVNGIAASTLTNAGLSVTGTLSATGASGGSIVLDSTAVGTENTITSTLNSGASYAVANYVALVHRFKYGATTIAAVSSTGLAVTGALSATGDISTSAAAGVKFSVLETSTGTAKRLYLSQDAAQVTYNATFSSGGNQHVFQTGNNERVRIGDTGLDVTGALSATGATTLGSATPTGIGAGEMGIPNSAALRWRNAANSAYLNAMYVNSSNKLIFGGSAVSGIELSVAGAGTVATVDASGNLGLGVAPSAWVTANNAALEIQKANLSFEGSNAYTSLTQYAYRATSDNSTGWIRTQTGVAPYQYQLRNGQGHVWRSGTAGTAGTATSWTDMMTLDTSGNLLVGQTTTGYQNSKSSYISSGAYIISHSTANVNGDTYVGFGYNAGQIGSITQSGTTAVAYNTTSDRRLKTNIRPADAARFMDIEFKDYEWIDGRHDCGPIADQLQLVYPSLVIGEKDAVEVRQVEIAPAVPAVLDEEGNELVAAIPAVTEAQTFPVYQQVNYPGLIGRIGVRVQQLQRTVDTQAALITALEARLTALESI